jgi:hypothetical protein
MNRPPLLLLARRSYGIHTRLRRTGLPVLAAALVWLVGSPSLGPFRSLGAAPISNDAPTAASRPPACPSGGCLEDRQSLPERPDPSVRVPFRPGKPTSPSPFSPVRRLPRFVAYWVATPGPPGCPDQKPCVAPVGSLDELLKLVEAWRRERGVEIVRFDARVTPSESVYLGGWQRSDRPHHLELDLNWGRFRRHHWRLVRKGHELIHLKFYEDDGRQRVAAIWRPRTPGSSTRERAIRAHDWQQLRRADSRARRKGFSLAEIEAYPRPDGPDDRWAAGVWRTGTVQTRLLDGLTCGSEHDAPVEVRVPSAVRRAVEGKDAYSHCGLLIELERQAEEGFQAVDFENYMEAGKEHWAVLLHKRSGPDWLQFAGTEHDVTERESILDAEPVETGYGLLDLDIYGISTVFGFPHLHEGLVHDGGTSGPPEDGKAAARTIGGSGVGPGRR